MTDLERDLIEAARRVRERSYSPYSRFRVGAALRCDDGAVITGTNVENASFGLSICAERSAVARAIAEGRRRFTAIAIVADPDLPTPPCGACRQVLLEFAPDLDVILAGAQGADGPIIRTTVRELMPHAFSDFPGSRTPRPGTETP
ncbi:MAG: cytidine deaminase [Candidatus Krumholzibacteriia bacterium]